MIVEADVDEVVEVLDVDKDDEVIGTDVVVDCEFTNFSLSIVQNFDHELARGPKNSFAVL